MELTTAQHHQFDVFGYLRIRGALADVIDQIRADFDATVRHEQLGVLACRQFMDGTVTDTDSHARMLVPDPVGDDRPLRWLLDHPLLRAIPRSLLAPGGGYAFSFANVYNCNVHWHDDGIFEVGGGSFVNVAVYLEPLGATNGALRVIPGSHRAGAFREDLQAELMGGALPITEAFGLAADELPAQVLDVVPGDVIILHPRIVHASFHGGIGRRLLTVVFGAEPARSASFVQPVVASARPATAEEQQRSLTRRDVPHDRPVLVGAGRS